MLENYVNQINPDIKLSEVWLLEIRLYGEDNLIFVFFTKAQFLPGHQRKTMLIYKFQILCYVKRNVINDLWGILTPEK